MTNVITFSGWGQKYNALDNIAPNARHINYNCHDDIDNLCDSIDGSNCDILIGWSLGGQLALRAVENGTIKTSLIVLLSTPFQFVKANDFNCGIDANDYYNFKKQFISNPEKTLQKFSFLIANGDKNAKKIVIELQNNKDIIDASNWLYWLNELKSFSCKTMNYSNMPKTLAIIGSSDQIINTNQIDLFKPLIKNYTTNIFNNCGHAPHLHNCAKVIQLIKDAA